MNGYPPLGGDPDFSGQSFIFSKKSSSYGFNPTLIRSIAALQIFSLTSRYLENTVNHVIV